MWAIRITMAWLVVRSEGHRVRCKDDLAQSISRLDSRIIFRRDAMSSLENLRTFLFATSGLMGRRQGGLITRPALRSHNDKKNHIHRFVESHSLASSRARVLMKALGNEVDLLLAGPTESLICELASPSSNLTISLLSASKCLDTVCEHAAGATNLPQEEEIALQKDLKRTYVALQQKGILRAFGSCSDALKPLPRTFSPQDQQLATGLPISSFAPTGSNGDFLIGSAVALGMVYGSQSLGIDLRLLGGAIVGALAADRLALRGAIFESISNVVQPAYRETVLLHEAGHFLVAYLLGNPIQSCLLDAWSATKDGRFSGVAAGTVFFDPELGGGMISGRLTRECIDRYSIVAMAGIAAEAKENGKAEGGKADETALIQLLASLDNGASWDYNRIQNQARWAGTQAFLLLKDHESAYIALRKALREGATVGEAVMAIESAMSGSELPATQRKKELLDAVSENKQNPSSPSSQTNVALTAERDDKDDIVKRLAEIDKRLSELDSTTDD